MSVINTDFASSDGVWDSVLVSVVPRSTVVSLPSWLNTNTRETDYRAKIINHLAFLADSLRYPKHLQRKKNSFSLWRADFRKNRNWLSWYKSWFYNKYGKNYKNLLKINSIYV